MKNTAWKTQEEIRGVISTVVLNTVFLQRELDNLPTQVQIIGARRTGCSLYNGA